MMLVVRIAGPAGQVLAGIRSAVDEVDRDLPFAQVAALDDLLDNRLAARRFNAWLLSSFAVAAVVLTTVGLYGLLAYLVILRRRELAVRLALGATAGQILRLVAVRGMWITGSGAAVGLGAAWLAAGWIRHMIPGVATDEPRLFLLVAAVVALGTLVATFTPVRRAMRVDPAATLRSE
jgi:ABC-type antimicrobial peptide transport system permease subunit